MTLLPCPKNSILFQNLKFVLYFLAVFLTFHPPDLFFYILLLVFQDPLGDLIPGTIYAVWPTSLVGSIYCTVTQGAI